MNFKTLRIDRRKNVENGEAREGRVTITSQGDYEGRVKFRCHCSSFGCSCNFDSASIELCDINNVIVVSLSLDPNKFNIGRARDRDISYEGHNQKVADAYAQIILAELMFACTTI